MNISAFNKYIEYGDELVLTLKNGKQIRITEVANGGFHIFDFTPMSNGYSVSAATPCSFHFTPTEEKEIRLSMPKTED